MRHTLKIDEGTQRFLVVLIDSLALALERVLKNTIFWRGGK